MSGFPLRKMTAEPGTPLPGMVVPELVYALQGANGSLPLAEHIGAVFTIRFTGVRTCVSCGKQVKKFYGQGLCWPCFQNAPEASPCIIRPELCEAHLGKGRDVEWERDHHLQEHFVYLAFTGDVKVGVTRGTQIPTRWVDQGAVAAVPIARVPYRRIAGDLEVNLKQFFADRTEWRRMLLYAESGKEAEVLLEARLKALALASPEFQPYLLAAEPLVYLGYPLRHTPPKLVSVQLDKLPEVTGKLAGIKGQYLVWSDGRVLNVRNHIGYHVEVDPL